MVIHEITVTCSFVILHDYKHENYDEIVPYGKDYMEPNPISFMLLNIHLVCFPCVVKLTTLKLNLSGQWAVHYVSDKWTEMSIARNIKC